MPSIVLTDKAQSDLDSIHEHYQGALGVDGADAVILAILETLGQLQRFPGSGRPSVAPDIRELVLTRYPFVAPYRQVRGQLQILRILHQRTERPQDWSPE
ncbi:type II toxin-antitoxin system RelE/ParE family toxin [Pseudomonas citrulli]|uniref:Type II toxin-antitoxin system RelE/ParE family toxin n=1 Tax=Pseudomonas citrulli TaxID=3064347 RepID=A0ABT9C376_9PSED|nr:type II toxin-antitoxin system RelE/ParE family toxin [Pseudomonas sp. K18]MDO7899253.1 type II toxin-antitoxin system RelE/ParE family toxin [Pseudomonas sp. K18]